MLAEIGVPFDEIVDRLSERSDDECYSAFHWVANAAHRDGAANPFPVLDRRDPKWRIAGMPKALLQCIEFPKDTPDILKELTALGMEHVYRELFRSPTPPSREH